MRADLRKSGQGGEVGAGRERLDLGAITWLRHRRKATWETFGALWFKTWNVRRRAEEDMKWRRRKRFLPGDEDGTARDGSQPEVQEGTHLTQICHTVGVGLFRNDLEMVVLRERG